MIQVYWSSLSRLIVVKAVAYARFSTPNLPRHLLWSCQRRGNVRNPRFPPSSYLGRQPCCCGHPWNIRPSLSLLTLSVEVVVALARPLVLFLSSIEIGYWKARRAILVGTWRKFIGSAARSSFSYFPLRSRDCRLPCIIQISSHVFPFPIQITARKRVGVENYRYNTLKSGSQVWWTLCLPFLTTSSWPCLQPSRNLGPTF